MKSVCLQCPNISAIINESILQHVEATIFKMVVYKQNILQNVKISATWVSTKICTSGVTNICRSSLAIVTYFKFTSSCYLHLHSDSYLQNNVNVVRSYRTNWKTAHFQKTQLSGGTNICRSSLSNVDLLHVSLLHVLTSDSGTSS